MKDLEEGYKDELKIIREEFETERYMNGLLYLGFAYANYYIPGALWPLYIPLPAQLLTFGNSI